METSVDLLSWAVGAGSVVGFLDSYWPFIIPGLVSGAIYALLATGLVLTYRSTGVLNLAFGAQAYVSAVVYYELRVGAEWPSVPAVLLAVFGVAPLLGYVLERMVFRYLRGQPMLIKIGVSIGMLVAIPAIAQMLLGSDDRPAPPPIFLSPVRFYQWGSLSLDSDQIAVIVTTVVVLIAFGLFMTFSDLGLRMRAVVESSRLSELHGVGSVGVSSAAWLLSSLFAGLAGVMLAPLFPTLTPINYTLLLMAAVAAAVFGRLSSLSLTVVGALVTGIGQNIILKFFSVSGALATGLRPSFPFLLLFGLLIAYQRVFSQGRSSDPLSGVDPPPTLAGVGIGSLPGTRVQRSAALVGVLALMFLFLNPFWSGVVAKGALMSVVFLSLMLLVGQSGYISLCHAAFVGHGAWVTGQLTLEQDWPILLAVLAGAAAAGIGGLILAIPSVRLGELPMALATFGFGILSTTLVFNQPWSFGSASGLLIPRPDLGPIDFASNKSFMALAFVILALTILFIRHLLAGTTGRFATAMRGSPTAAASIGINGTPLRLAIFVLSAAMAGLAGGLMGTLDRLVAPASYGVNTSLYWLVVALVIGVYTVRGAVAAGFIVVLLPQVVSELPDTFGLLEFALFGLGVVLLARHSEGAFEYFVSLPARMRERTRMLSGSATSEEHLQALARAEAEPIPEDEEDAPVELLPSTAEERRERRERRRQLVMDALRLRARMPSYPITFLYVLTLAFSIDAMSRSLLSIVLEDVRRDFGVTDFDMSALNAGYAIVAGLSVIPFGIIADRWSRRKLIALGFLPWGVAMMFQSVAGTFMLLFIARLFLGSIEGTNGPATPSLLGDYYPVRRRSRAFGIFATGTSLGTVLGLMFGGALAEALGWRGSFFVFGVMGLIIGFVLWRMLDEPERGLQDTLYRLESEIESIDRVEDLEAEALANPDMAPVIVEQAKLAARGGDGKAGGEPPGPPTDGDAAPTPSAEQEEPTFDYRDVTTAQSAVLLAKNRTFSILLAGQVATDFFIGILAFFAVTFFRRYHGLSVAGASGIIALLSIAIIIGTVQAGRIGDRLVGRGTPAARVKLIWLARLLVFGSMAVAFATQQLAVAIPFFLINGYLLGLTNPLTQAISVDIIPAWLRGRSTGLIAAIRAGGTALGPLALGYLSDLYGLRQGTLLLAPFLLLSALITWYGGRSYDKDEDRARRESVRQHVLQEADPRVAAQETAGAPPDLDPVGAVQPGAEGPHVDRSTDL